MQKDSHSSIKGRGSAANPTNRFESVSREKITDSDWEEDEEPSPGTQFLPDASRTIISYNSSPDVGFEASINPYRGCEHGCAYCYARPTHEYLGFSAGLDFETKIMVKEEAPELLREELSRRSWKPVVLVMSGVTDPYQPVEKKRQLTRKCLEVLLEFRNPVVIITKNHLVVRDKDLLSTLARFQSAAVFISITTLDRDLCGILEPRTSRPQKKLEAISAMRTEGIPAGVMVAPVIPGLTDLEIPRILEAAAEAGARFAGMVPLRLPFAVAPLFEAWLERHLPGQKKKILNRIREIRGGKLNDPEFGSRMTGKGIFAKQIHDLFDLSCKKLNLNQEELPLLTRNFRPPSGSQLSLFH
ncbi:MAG: PA0069 family radical SAM protein [Nitrospiria bacterium]